MKPTQGGYIVGLDHLRAFAAFLVLYWHTIHYWEPARYVPAYWAASIFEEGWFGVSLFITITGFVFTTLTHGKTIEYRSFLKNRFLRIFPLMFFVVLYAVAVKKADMTAFLVFFNLLGGGIVYGTWTLVVEWQFYISFPFLRSALTSTSLWSTIARCLTFCLFFVIFRSIFFLDTAPERPALQTMAYWTLLGQADSFLFGIIAGHVYLAARSLDERFVLPFAGVILTLASVGGAWAFHQFNLAGGFYNQPSYPSDAPIWIIWPTICGAIFGVFVCAYCLLTKNMTGWIARSVAYLGAISYSTYMLHFITYPVAQDIWNKYIWFEFSTDRFTNGSLVVLLFQYPVILIVSALCYHFIEKPFLRHRVPYLSPVLKRPADQATPVTPVTRAVRVG